MTTAADFEEIARVLAMQSHVTSHRQVAYELWRVAQDRVTA